VLGSYGEQKIVRMGTMEYGARAQDLSHMDKLPWGNYAEPEYTGLSWWWHQGKSLVWDGFIVDGIWGTVTGIDILLGCDGWDAAGQAWKGLAKVATGLTIMITPGLNGAFLSAPDSVMPKWFRESRTALKETGKALIAYDQWGKNPARAAGGVTFNVLTTVFTGGAGAAAKGGAVAKTISVLGKVGRVVDPMTYVFTAGKFGVVKVADVFKGLKGLSVGPLTDAAHLTHDPNVPHVTDTYAEWSDGTRLSFKDGIVTRPDGTVSAARVELSADQIAQLKNSPPHAAETSLPGAKSPALVTAGERAGHVENATGHSTGSAHPGDGSPPASGGSGGGGTHNTPSTGGHATGHQTGNGSGNGAASHTPSDGSGHGTPGHSDHETGDHGDGPSSGDGSGIGDGPGSGSGNPERQPAVILEGDRIGQQPSGPMAPEQEAAVTAALKDVKVPPGDQGRMLTQLRKSEYGAAVAEYISSGRFADIPMFKEPKGLLFQVKQNGMIPAVHQAMEHAAELQAKGIKNIEFELKLPEKQLDLDVLVRVDGRIEYGAQLKDVDSVVGIKSAVKKIAEKQLAGPGVDVKVGILDINGLRSELTERDIQAVQRAADRTNASFELKFDDGAVTIYPTNAAKR
ncbi:hypothetical protein ACFYOD_18555, partial [Streptomyces sp. NPDC006703]|uniref:hypothetical protein n=1 Tax=Streptomyces sp. NPDC006703 TaxID=3364759 RepID=UPI0036BD92D7